MPNLRTLARHTVTTEGPSTAAADRGMTLRRASGEADWWAVRELIAELWPCGPPGAGWEVRRWDGRRFHEAAPSEGAGIGQRLAVLTDDSGRIVAAVHDDGQGSAALQAPPDGCLDDRLLDWAERHLTACDGSLTVEAPDDSPRAAILHARGYRSTGQGMAVRRRRLDGLVVPPVPRGYRMVEVGPEHGAAMAGLLNAAFDRSIHTAAEFRAFATRAPAFDRALHLAAVDAAGMFVAHVGVTIDARNAVAIVEPVCTHPDHRGRGLAGALLPTALARAVARGATHATLDAAETDPAAALYDACGFRPVGHVTAWRRDGLVVAPLTTPPIGDPSLEGGHP
jgi:GNAT superfamily N-acetyltransferase